MRSHSALGSGARTVTLLLVFAIGMTSSGLPAAARVYTEKDFLAYKERLQKRYDVALNSLQKDLRGQKSKLEAQHKLVGQQEGLVEQQAQMLEQQSKILEQQNQVIEQQVRLLAQQSRLIDQQSQRFNKHLGRLNALSLFIFGLGLTVWMLTLLGGRAVYLHLRQRQGSADAVIAPDFVGRALMWCRDTWRRVSKRTQREFLAAKSAVQRKLGLREAGADDEPVAQDNITGDDFEALLEQLSDDLDADDAFRERHTLALEALMDGDTA